MRARARAKRTNIKKIKNSELQLERVFQPRVHIKILLNDLISFVLATLFFLLVFLFISCSEALPHYPCHSSDSREINANMLRHDDDSDGDNGNDNDGKWRMAMSVH